jgi:hypothetical protein
VVPFVRGAFVNNSNSKKTYITTNQKRKVAQQREVSLELVTKEQFFKEKRSTHSTTTSPLPTR